MQKAEPLFENDSPEAARAVPGAKNLPSLFDELDAQPLPWDERMDRIDDAARILDADPAAFSHLVVERLRCGDRLPEQPGSVGAFEAASSDLAFPLLDDALGISICAPDWRELLSNGFVRTATEMACGRPVLLCADERAPELAFAIRDAFHSAGFSAGSIAVTENARRDDLKELLADPRVRAVSASGSAARIVELRHLCQQTGIESQRLVTLRCAAYEVDVGEDIEAAAKRVAFRAFGLNTCGGQLPGQVARAFIPQASYSSFVECLLECMDTIDELRSLVAHIDRDAALRTQKAWIQGLDEGATMISGGEEEMTGDPLRLPPTVFCNVEPHMRGARRQEPLPVLCLLRSS